MANKFDAMYDISEMVAECEELAQNDTSSDYVEVPEGEYEVKLAKCELGESKTSGRPMVITWFKVLVGEYKDQYIFKYDVVDEPKKINWVMRDLSKLGKTDGLAFTSYTALEELCNGIEQLEPELIVKIKINGNYRNVYIQEVFE